MKITRNVLKIECNSEELKSSNTLAEGFANLFRGVFNYTGSSDDYDVEIDEEEDEE